MENEEINNISYRKMVEEEIEKLHEKVSKENEKIIKWTTVTQDTAWDLKNKLEEVVRDCERLQQNLVEIQMQYETVSGQYQEELRLRPYTLIKLSTTCKITDILEEYVGRLKEALSRCKADQSSLYKASQVSGQVVRDLLQKNQEFDENNRQVIEALQDKVNTANEHKKQFYLLFSEVRQQVGSQMAKLREKLEEAFKCKEELLANITELQRNLDLSKLDLEKEYSNTSEIRQSQIAEIMGEKKRLLKEIEKNKQLLASHKEEIENFKQQITTIEIEKCEIISDMYKAMEDLRQQRHEVENEYQNYRETSENKEKELMRVIEARDKELDSDASKSTQLMYELKTSTDVRSKLETTIQKYKKEIDDTTEKEKKSIESIIKLETELKNKDQMWSEKFSLVTENNRIEKKRQAEKIRELENTIENIRSQVKLRNPMPRKLLEHELDDNAVMPSLQNQIPEIKRRFFAITRGEPFSSVPVSPILRCNVARSSSQGRPKSQTPQGFEAQHTHNQGPKRAKTCCFKFFKTKQGEIKRKKLK